MNTELQQSLQANLAIARSQIETMRRPKSSMDAALTSHWILFFFDTTHHVIHAYEGKDPIACLESVKRNHQDFEYITCRGMPSSGSAIEWVKSFRLVAQVTPELVLMLETLRKSYPTSCASVSLPASLPVHQSASQPT